MMPLNNIFRKCTGDNKFTKLSEKINPLMYRKDIKLFAKKWKRIGKYDTNKKNIHPGYRNGICQRNICHDYNKKWKKTNSRQNRTAKSRKNQTLGEQGNYKYLRILEADTIKQVKMKEKIRKEYLRRTRKLLVAKICYRNFIKVINFWVVLLVRYSRPFLK